jgi:predicted DsbA family dithiol-disulfide isomerase
MLDEGGGSMLSFIYDYNCPFCYCEIPMIKRFLNEGVKIEFIPWKMPDDADPPAKPEGYGEAAQAALSTLTAELQLPYRPMRKTDTTLAHEAGLYVVENAPELQMAYHEAVFRARFADGKDLADEKVIDAVLQDLGLSANDFHEKRKTGTYRRLLEQKYAHSAKEKIWTIPSFQGKGGTIQVHHFKDMPSYEMVQRLL